jgi:hypothetical protein
MIIKICQILGLSLGREETVNIKQIAAHIPDQRMVDRQEKLAEHYKKVFLIKRTSGGQIGDKVMKIVLNQ